MKDYEEIFGNNAPEKLMNAVKNGLDVNLMNYRDDGDYDRYNETFFRGTVRYGTPDLVKTCIEMGAEVGRDDLLVALWRLDAAVLRSLLEGGTKTELLDRVSWDFARNDIPEAAYDERAAEIKRRLDAGAEILKVLREAGFRVTGMDGDDGETSFYDIHSGHWDDEWRESEHDPYYENMYAYTAEEQFPCYGTRPGALWHAVSPEALKKMIAAGGDVNAADAIGWTALHHLAYYCDSKYYFKPNAMIQVLLDAGADINAICEREKMTPLTLAAMRVKHNPKALETLKLLLCQGADFDTEDCDVIWWMRDYWYADGLYDKRILDEILFEIYYFAQPENAKSRYEKLKHEEFRHKPLSKDDIDLMTAAFWGTPEDLAPILARGADINARSEYGYTPLMFASVWNHAPAVQFLLDRGACLDAENDRNETALDMAEKTHDRPVIGTLHKALLDLEGTDSLGDTPLMRILYSCHDQKLVQSFIDRGADVNAKNERGETALMIVAETTYDTGVARVLLDAGADANARDNQGMTALDTALNYGSEYDDDAIEFVEFLLSNGADPKLMALETPNRGGTDSLAESVLPEFGLKPCARFRGVFAENSAEEIASAVKNGLDLFCEDADREDFFEAALKYGSADVVRACLEQVSDVNKDWNAARIMKWMLRTAIEARGAEAVKALLEAGARAREEENLKWHERANVFPEGTDGSEEAREFKARLDAGEEILRLLREAGADVHEEKNVTYTGIGSSYSHNKYSLLYRPLGKNSEDADLRALVRAVSPGALKLLIREGAGVKTRGDGGCTALHAIALDFAEYFEPCAMLRLLLDAGADVNARDKEGITPLMILADNLEKLPRVMNAVKILAEAGADFRARDSEKRSVYDRVERLSGSAAEKLMRRELMDAIKRAFGAKSRASVKKRADADMLLAAFCGTAAEIESALARGANANAASKNGYTALMFASVFNATETAQCLIDNGADVDAKTRVNETALTLTALSERPDTQTIRALIAAGADVKAADGEGKTLLMKAMENSRYKAARVLMASGADVGCIIGGAGKPKKEKKYKENRHDAENREAEAMLRKFGLDV